MSSSPTRPVSGREVPEFCTQITGYRYVSSTTGPPDCGHNCWACGGLYCEQNCAAQIPELPTGCGISQVVDAEGRSRSVERKCLRQVFQQLTSPSAIGDEMQPSPEVFATVEINGARFFKWQLRAWSDWCLAHAAARSAQGEWPCWLSRLNHASAEAQRHER